MQKKIYFEDYQQGLSRVTFGRTIGEADIIAHAAHTGDFFPQHMDAVYAAQTPLGQRVAHGTMVFSIGVGLTATLMNPVAYSIGYDNLRFIRAVFIGDTIRTRVTVAAKQEEPKRRDVGRVIEQISVINQKDETVLTADHILLVERNQKNGRN